jgi:hypothetical protein
MSGYTENAVAHPGMLDPNIPFLPKPVVPSVLRDVINQVLRGGNGREMTDLF